MSEHPVVALGHVLAHHGGGAHQGGAFQGGEVPPVRNRAGRLSKDRFAIDLDGNTVTCLYGTARAIGDRPGQGSLPVLRNRSSAARRSYARRTGAERSFSTLKGAATTDTRRGWCRLLGRTKNLVVFACAAVVRNLRVLASFQRRQADAIRRAAAGQPPPTRARRRSEAAEPT